MAVHVDLSESILDPPSVMDFIKRHTDDRPLENILFKVSRETFLLYRQGWSANRVRATMEETKEMNEFLGVDWEPDDYVMGRPVICSNCARLITFYDIFQSGCLQHGDDRIKRILAGGSFHLQVAKKGQMLEVICTACGIKNMSKKYTHYHTASYCYI